MAYVGPPPDTPNSQRYLALEVPLIDDEEPLRDVVRKLLEYVGLAHDI